MIRSLRRKSWLERASWGRYLLIPAEMGPEALGEGNVLALASRIADTYYFGYGTAATHYGLTTQHRRVIWLVTPVRARAIARTCRRERQIILRTKKTETRRDRVSGRLATRRQCQQG